jgi:drug/metabolite transporter (DMT)-like permease
MSIHEHHDAALQSFEDAMKPYLKLIAVSTIWGGTFVAGRLLAGHLTPLPAASLRFLLASTVLLCVMFSNETAMPRPSPRQWLQLALLGLAGIFAYNLCFFYGLERISASRASLIVALNPACIALASRLLLRENLAGHKIAGIALSLVGALLVILGRDGAALQGGAQGNLPGDLLIGGCVLSWVSYSVGSKRLSSELGPLATVTYSILFGTAMLCALTTLRGEWNMADLAELGGPQWLSLLYLGVAGSALAYVWYYDAIRLLGATRAGVFIALNPVSAVSLGALLLGETLTVQAALGGVGVILGIVLCNRQAGRVRPPIAAVENC